MLAIIDYGMGNLRSAQKGLEKVGEEVVVTSQPEGLAQAQGLVLPGVGAFGDAWQALVKTGLASAISQAVAAGKPLLGICLGLQLLFTTSEEGGLHPGLNFIPGRVVSLPPGVKIPHMGWNQIEISFPHPLLKGIDSGENFYFVHSYYVAPENPGVILAYTTYGERFAAVVGKGNIYGVQFHPEKSSQAGLRILKNFGELVKNAAYSRS